jgi:glycosidase
MLSGAAEPRRRPTAHAFLLCAIAALVVAGAAGAQTRADSATPPALAALAAAPIYSSLASQRVYFVLPDRYANGDSSNDRGGLTGTRGVTGYDPTDTGYFHGGDYKGLTGDCTDPKTGLARLRSLGFTAIWVTPPVRNQVTTGSSAGYHGYWGLDFTTVDPHLGTEQDFAAFVACAHSLGMKVYLDVVVNHTGDIVILPGGGFVSPSEIPYRDCRGKKFNPAAYVSKTFPCMNAQNMPRVPTILAEQRTAKKPAWMNDPTNYHDRGDIDFGSCSQVCFEQGDFFGLDDLFTEKPVVWQGLAEVFGDWITKYKVDGFRVDTARHVNAAFFKVWTPRILAAARTVGIPDFPVFGEIFSTDDQYVSSFVRDRGLPEALDFALQDAASGFAAGTTNARAIRSRLDDDDYYRTPSGRAPTPPTFLGNHDMGRAALQVKSKGSSDAQLLHRVLLGYDVLYLLRGAPVVYYGDEVGMIGRGGDQQARQDMFPTQVAEWRMQDRVGSPPIGTGSSFDVTDNPIQQRLRELANLRDQYPALSTGASIVRYASGRVLVVSRIDETTRAAGRQPESYRAGLGREFVAAFNAGTTAARVTVPVASTASWERVFGSATATSAGSARVTLSIPAISSALFAASAPIAIPAPAAPAVRVGGDTLSNMWRVSATVKGTAPVSVTFAVRRGSGAWKRLAADDSPPYRAFLDPAKYRKKERLQVAAVVRALDGRTAASKVVPFRIRPR